ncbi:rab GTPase-binding effector protein 1-like isoform X2 [Liolophura sinensis]|uniref:rab GTPase-binding effector protein 1-like isoform X2 n=1 Tax=Liolophura sinensis TaxID=3198878 RepID=UPI0031592958
MTDLDDFGPMETAENNIEVVDRDNEEILGLRLRLERLEKAQQDLLREKEETDEDFGKKRAKFKEIFIQKEAELRKEKELHSEAREKVKTLSEQLSLVKDELEGVKTAAAVSEAGKEDEVDEIRRQFQGEVASLQHIMKDAAEEAARTASDEMKEQNLTLLTENRRLEQEIQSLQSQLSQEREGFLASVAKTLQKKVGVPGFGKPSSEDESLEDSMRKAQEDAEVLRSVVMPLEEEINTLKSKLRAAEMQLGISEGTMVRTMPDGAPTLPSSHTPKSPSLPDLDSCKDPEERVKELMHYLKAEKAARTDLEMYVAVLNTQKSVLQEDSEKLRAELHEVCRLLEQEKKEHSELKCTWQMANDQFLESQRLMMMDMRRMESVLSTEQQRQIAELQKRDLEREAQEKKVKDLEEMREKQRKQKEEERQAEMKAKKAAEAEDKMSKPSSLIGGALEKTKSESKASINSTMFDDVPDIGFSTPELGSAMRKSHSNSALEDGFLDSGIHETRSLQDADGQISPGESGASPALTEAQLRAIRDPTPELEARQSLLASVKSRTEAMSMEGRRIVSEKEWELLQRELKASREKLGRPCDMCSNYEAQLQSVQEELKDSTTKAQTLDRQLKSERHASTNQLKYQEELETNLKQVAEDASQQISSLVTKVTESEKYLSEVKQQFIQSQSELQDQLKSLTAGREEIQKELVKLQNENDSLVGKHSKHAQQLQNETINLPNNLDEMQLKLLQFREEIIAAKVAKEHMEETLKSEILFLKDQVVAEQQEKTTLEETLSQEINTLTEQLAVLQSVRSELERERSCRHESDQKLKETEHSLKSIQAKSKQLIQALQQQVEEQSTARTKLEQEALSHRAKLQSLQMDLDNSEAVQRDFVKLSQSLQIQLEKIRQAENEVRWQHEDDVEECNNCKQSFSVTRRKVRAKHHCRHCGKIFCADCTSKSVNSGPNFRASKVCDVCHTILIKDATPYFSTEVPTTPD